MLKNAITKNKSNIAENENSKDCVNFKSEPRVGGTPNSCNGEDEEEEKAGESSSKENLKLDDEMDPSDQSPVKESSETTVKVF